MVDGPATSVVGWNMFSSVKRKMKKKKEKKRRKKRKKFQFAPL